MAEGGVEIEKAKSIYHRLSKRTLDPTQQLTSLSFL